MGLDNPRIVQLQNRPPLSFLHTPFPSAPNSQTFTVEITEDFLNHVEEGVLGVEVWGHRRSGFMDIPLVTPGEPENEGRRQKSFPEK